MCKCICIQQDCPAGEVFDYECCMCRACTDQGKCEPGVEFFNPNTCSCNCLPEDCSGFGPEFVWVFTTCRCEEPCSEATAANALSPGATTCDGAVANATFDPLNCICVTPTQSNICDPNSGASYDPFDFSCSVATGGIHAIGCDIWVNCITDLDPRITTLLGNGSPIAAELPEEFIEGDVCQDGSDEDYIVEKALAGASGQIPVDDFFFAEDRSGNGANNPPQGVVPNYPTESYVYYFYVNNADRIKWDCTSWLSVDSAACADPANERVNVTTSNDDNAVELKIELHTDPNDLQDALTGV